MARGRGAAAFPCIVLAVVFVAGSAAADDRWSAPHAGIALLERRAPGPMELRVVFADLCTPGMRLRATRPDERGRTLSAFAEGASAVVAINGDFYELGFTPVGLAMGDGRHWPGTADTGDWGLFAAGEGRADVPERPHDPPAPWIHEAVGGAPQLVLDGVPVTSYFGRGCGRRHPRSAIGIDRERRTLIAVTVDGRSNESVGATCSELAELMSELGAWQALNLDGGGSSALYVRGRGIVNRPSDGAERPVANHLAILLGSYRGVNACPRGTQASRTEPSGTPSVRSDVVPVVHRHHTRACAVRAVHRRRQTVLCTAPAVHRRRRTVLRACPGIRWRRRARLCAFPRGASAPPRRLLRSR